MSDTSTCPECAASLPAAATFCTSCGHRMGASAPPTGGDETRIDQPGLQDATQSYAATPAATPPPAPWQPAETSAAPAAPAAPPWQPPAQQAPPAAPAWGAQQAPAAAPPWPQAQQPAAPQQWGAPMGAPQATASASGGSVLGGALGILGAVLTLVGLFTAWVGSNQSDATISGWDLVSGDKGLESKDPYIILALAIAAMAIGVVLFMGKSLPIVRILAILAGIAIAGVTARDWLSIVDFAKDLPSTVKLTAQFGFYLTIVGGVVVAVAGLMPAKKTA